MSLTSAASARPAARRQGRAPSRPRKSLGVAPTASQRARRAPFVIVVLMLLIGGLGTLLLLNTLLAQGSFAVRDLNLRVAELQDRQQALQQDVAALAAPQRLARRAAAIGMVPSVNPAFVRMKDGRVLGKPAAAVAPVVPSPIEVAPRGDNAATVDESPTGDDTRATEQKPQTQGDDAQDGASDNPGQPSGSGDGQQSNQGSSGSGNPAQ